MVIKLLPLFAYIAAYIGAFKVPFIAAYIALLD